MSRSIERPKRKRKRRWVKTRRWHGLYDDYLETRHWINKRRAYLRRYPQCAICGTIEDVQVHHKTYINLGREPDGDLITLCKKHHRLLHEHDVPKETGLKILLKEGENGMKDKPKRKKKEADNVLRLRLDPALIRDKSGDELNEIIEQEKAKLSQK